MILWYLFFICCTDYVNFDNHRRKQSLKLLIGSVGSKSNKGDYVKSLLSFLEQHPNTSKSVLWTPATTQVASLYSAADVYVINAQVGPVYFVYKVVDKILIHSYRYLLSHSLLVYEYN